MVKAIDYGQASIILFISHEPVRACWNRFGPGFAAELRRKRVDRMRGRNPRRWYLDEIFVKIDGMAHHL